MKQALTIAGSDSGGGAGIQADLKTFAALGVYGMSVITAVTAQNTKGVSAIENISGEVVTKQIEAIFNDFDVAAVKIGMVSNSEIIEAIIRGIKKWQPQNIIIDPIMVSESGIFLLEEGSRKKLVEELLPLANLLTPNTYEAAVILNTKIKNLVDMEKSIKELYHLINSPVLLKGGHLVGDAIDIFYDGKELLQFKSSRIKNDNNHGTGCTYSSAIASFLARGDKLTTAIGKAKEYVTEAIRNGLDIGQGPGPTHHFYRLEKYIN